MKNLPFELKVYILEYDGRFAYSKSQKKWICKIDKKTDERYQSLHTKYLPYKMREYSSGLLHKTWVMVLTKKIENHAQGSQSLSLAQGSQSLSLAQGSQSLSDGFVKWEHVVYYTEYDMDMSCKGIILYEWSKRYLHIDEYGNNIWHAERIKKHKIKF